MGLTRTSDPVKNQCSVKTFDKARNCRPNATFEEVFVARIRPEYFVEFVYLLLTTVNKNVLGNLLSERN